MKTNFGEQDLVKRGGGWSAVIHPFCVFLAAPHTGEEEKLITAGIDLAQLAAVKVWVDAAGHYKRPEVLRFVVERKPLWDDDTRIAGGRARREDEGPDKVEKAIERGEASRQEVGVVENRKT